jgi:hypothetical protein
MRRSILWHLFLILVLSAFLTACGGEPTAAPVDEAEPTIPSSVEEVPQMAVTPAPEEGGEARFQLLETNVFLDSRLGLVIVGIMQNTGDAASHPEPEPLQLVDASGNVVAEAIFNTLEMIAPGERAPLVGVIYEHQGIPENWQDLEVRMGEEGFPTELVFREFVRLDAEGTASRVFDAQVEGEPAIYGVSGWIVNNAGSPAADPMVYVAGYGAGGEVVDVARVYGSVEYLSPGTSAPFVATLSMVEPIASYEVFAEGEVVETRNLAEVEIADYIVTGPDERGRIELMGEVVNAGSALAVETQIVMVLVTEQGEVVTIDSTIGSAISLAPGERLPFKFSSTLLPELQSQWERPEFLVQGFSEDSLSDRHTGVYTDLALEGLDTLQEEFGRYRLTGQITNTGQSKALVDVLGALCNAEGKVIDCASCYVGMLDPGGSMALELSFSAAEGEEVASFKVLYGGLTTKY